VIAELSQSPLFWIGLIQWLAMFPLVVVVQHFVVPDLKLPFQLALDFAIFAVVVTTILIGPLYVAGYLPLPGKPLITHYMWGALAGGFASIPIRELLKRHFQRTDAPKAT